MTDKAVAPETELTSPVADNSEKKVRLEGSKILEMDESGDGFFTTNAPANKAVDAAVDVSMLEGGERPPSPTPSQGSASGAATKLVEVGEGADVYFTSAPEALRWLPPDLSEEQLNATARSGLEKDKPWFAKSVIPLELGFFRRLFSILNSRFGENGEISIAHFERTMLRLYKIVGESGPEREGANFKAEDFDVDGSGAVGWWEFVACWKANDFNIPITFAERLWLSVEDVSSSAFAQLVQSIVMLMIILSSSCFMVATLPSLKSAADGCSPRCDNPTTTSDIDFCKERCEPEQSEFFWIVELLCVVVFTVEYGVRIAAYPFARAELFSQEILMDMCVGDLPVSFQTSHVRLFNFFFSPANLVDFFAILPFYLELLLASAFDIRGTAVLRVIRLTRLFRLMKAVKYFETLLIIGRVLRKSMQALTVLIFYLALCVCFSASLLYFAESGEWDPVEEEWMRTNWVDDSRSPTPFKSIPHSFWWCFVTYTTVGYGDMVPFSGLGQMFATATMVVGLLVLAMPISVLSANFSQVWKEHEEEARLRMKSDEIEREAVQSALAIKDPAEQFRRVLLELWDEDALGERDFLGEAQIEFDMIGKEPKECDGGRKFETIVCKFSPNMLKHTNDKVVPKGRIKLLVSWTPLPYDTDENGEPAPPKENEDGDSPTSKAAEKYKRKKVPEKRTHINYQSEQLWPGHLTIIVHSAEDVAPADFSIFASGGSSDPFVVITCWPMVPNANGALSTKTNRTKTQYATLDPAWNEMMDFEFLWTNPENLARKDQPKPSPFDGLDPALAAEMQMASKGGAPGTYSSLNEKLLKMELDDAPDPYDKQTFDLLMDFQKEFSAEMDETKQMLLDLMEMTRKQHKQLVKELGLGKTKKKDKDAE
ncbi:unnamed protein product [Amoebophrya sp. A25]|nr:unnamed protein product [Amoebophrya sp. A25]|eukprot:GSA25T00007186001.1